MTINAKKSAIALVLTTALGFALLVKQCSTTTEVRKERDSYKAKAIALRDTANQLVRLILRKDSELLDYKDKEREGRQESERMRGVIERQAFEKKQALDKLSASQIKLEALRVAFRNGDITAQRLRDSLSAMPVFTDEEANRKYLELVSERNLWRDSTRSVYEQLGQSRYETSREKAAHSATLTAVANVRTSVQNKRSKASKGIIRQVVNAGKIKALKEVDEDLSAIQESELERALNPR